MTLTDAENKNKLDLKKTFRIFCKNRYLKLEMYTTDDARKIFEAI